MEETKKMKTGIRISLVCLMLLSTGVLAEGNIDALLLVSTRNYPDRMVAAPAAEKYGVPIILTEGDALSEETLNAIEAFSPEKIIIIGGLAVVGGEVEDMLSEDYEVVRLWGVTRYGTAEAVADYFWPEGSEEAMLVEDDMDSKDNNVLAQAAEEARIRGVPLLLTPESNIPANTLAEMNNLRVKKVVSIAFNAEARERLRNQLRDADIDVDEIDGLDGKQIRDNIKKRIATRLDKTNTLVVVAAANFTHAVNAPNLPQARAFIVTGTDQIGDVASAIKDRGIERVMVTGKPEFAQQITGELEEKTDAEVRQITGRNVKQRIVANNLSKQSREEFQELFRKKTAERAQIIERFGNSLSSRSNSTLRRAWGVAGDDPPQVARNALMKAEQYCAGRDYPNCIKKAIKAMLTTRLSRYGGIIDNRTAVREEIRGEVKDLEEKVSELRELNREFGEEMEQNMATQERLQIIQEFKYQRKENVKEIIGEAKSITAIVRSNAAAQQKSNKITSPASDVNVTKGEDKGKA